MAATGNLTHRFLGPRGGTGSVKRAAFRVAPDFPQKISGFAFLKKDGYFSHTRGSIKIFQHVCAGAAAVP